MIKKILFRRTVSLFDNLSQMAGEYIIYDDCFHCAI